MLNKGVMKIKTVFRAPQEPVIVSKPKIVKVKQVFKTQTIIEKQSRQKWQVWEYKKEKKTNYDNHYIYRLATYSQANLMNKLRLEREGVLDQNPYRWRLYKRIKKIQKTLA